ncbi:MAG: response regulator transcription factor [Deltaproteobacteria bacterium]|nr:response regulator transcription factor [Deltaproteobacteria bacterium]
MVEAVKCFSALLVEDNDLYRNQLRERIERLFPSIIIEEACDGLQAFQKIEGLQPDLIFMDIHLPGENGLKLTARIKAAYPAVSIVILTSYDMPEYQEAALQHGACDFIPKDALGYDRIEKLVGSIKNKEPYSPALS